METSYQINTDNRCQQCVHYLQNDEYDWCHMCAMECDHFKKKEMPDREKVIPHFQDALQASGDNNKWRFVRADIIEDAIALLKEQEPVEPAIGGNQKSCWYYICPICQLAIDKGDKYCRHCGRAVKWE